MATHPTFLAFERRWQLPVYFQLRWKDIVMRLEDSLSTSKLEPESSFKKGLLGRVWDAVTILTMMVRTAEISPFAMSSSVAVWTAITTCWDRNIYVPQLAHRFWKLMLQILSRHRTWIQNSVTSFPLDSGKSLPSANEKVCVINVLPSQSLSITKLLTPGDTPKAVSRSSTPTPQAEGSSSESVSVDDTLLRQCAAVIADVKLLESKTWVLWREEISPMIGSLFVEEDVPSEHVQAEGASLVYIFSALLRSLTVSCRRPESGSAEPDRSDSTTIFAGGIGLDTPGKRCATARALHATAVPCYVEQTSTHGTKFLRCGSSAPGPCLLRVGIRDGAWCVPEGGTDATVRTRGIRGRGPKIHILCDGDAQEGGIAEETQEGEKARVFTFRRNAKGGRRARRGTDKTTDGARRRGVRKGRWDTWRRCTRERQLQVLA